MSTNYGTTDDLPPIDTVVLDLDGTLVDSVSVHVLAWQRSFRDVGLQIASHRLHAVIGMGGDRLVSAVAGEAAERSLGDEVRERHPQHLDELFADIRPTEGATDMLAAMHRIGLELILASSSERELTDRLLALVPGATDLIGTVVTGSDAEESKPDGELVQRALDTASSSRAVMVGDAVWDGHSAADAGIGFVGLLTGGITEATLSSAGAVAVYETPRDLARHLADVSRWVPGF